MGRLQQCSRPLSLAGLSCLAGGVFGVAFGLGFFLAELFAFLACAALVGKLGGFGRRDVGFCGGDTVSRRLLGQVKRNKLAELTARDALRLFGGNGPTMEELTPALDLLVESDWLRELPAAPRVTGRKPSPRYAVNPAALA